MQDGKTLLDSLYEEPSASASGGASVLDALFAEHEATQAPSTLKEMGKAYLKPLANLSAYAADAYGTFLSLDPRSRGGARPLHEWAAEHRAKVEADLGPDPRSVNQNAVQRYATNLSGAAGSVAEAVSIGAITGPIGAIGTGAAQMSSDLRAEARDAGADEEAQTNMALAGAGIGVLGSIIPVRLITNANKASGGLVRRYLVEQGVAGGTFAGQRVLTNLAAKYNFDEHRKWSAGIGEDLALSVPFAGFATATHGRFATKARETPPSRVEASPADLNAQDALVSFVSANQRAGQNVEGARIFTPGEHDNPFVQLAYRSGTPVYYADIGRRTPFDGTITDNGVVVIDAHADPKTQARIILSHEIGHQAVTKEMQRNGGTPTEAAGRLLASMPPELVKQVREVQRVKRQGVGQEIAPEILAEETFAGLVDAYAGVSFHAATDPITYAASIDKAQTGTWVANLADNVIGALNKLKLNLRTFEQRRLEALRSAYALSGAERADSPQRTLDIGRAIGKVLAEQFEATPYSQPERSSFQGIEPFWPTATDADVAATEFFMQGMRITDPARMLEARNVPHEKSGPTINLPARMPAEPTPESAPGFLPETHPLLAFERADIERELGRALAYEGDTARKSFKAQGDAYADAFTDLRRKARDQENPERARSAEQLRSLYAKLPPDQTQRLKSSGGRFAVEELQAALRAIDVKDVFTELHGEAGAFKGSRAQSGLRQKYNDAARRISSDERFHVTPPEEFASIPGLEERGIMDLTDRWIGDRDVAFAKARIGARMNYDKIRAVITGGARIGFLEGARNTAKTGERVPGTRAVLAAMYAHTERKILEANYTPEEQHAIVQGVKESKDPLAWQAYQDASNLPKELRDIADRMVAENVEVGRQAADASVIKNTIENYQKRLYKDEKRGSGPIQPRLTLNTKAARKRSYDSVFEAIANGKELRSWDPVLAQETMRRDLVQTIADKNFFRAGIKNGLISLEHREGFSPIDHPNFKEWRILARIASGPEYAELQKFGNSPNARFDADGNLWVAAQAYAKDGLAKGINAVVGESGMNKMPGWRALQDVGAQVKGWLFMASFFNHIDAVVRTTLATPGNPLKLLSGRESYQHAGKMIDAFSDDLQAGVRAGLRLDAGPDIADAFRGERGKLDAAIEKVPYARDVKNLLYYLRDRQHDNLFHVVLPRIKLMSYLAEHAQLVKRNEAQIKAGTLSPESLAKTAAANVNEKYGGLNLERMGRNKTTQDVARAVLLAPDWTEGNINLIAKAFAKGHVGSAYRAMWGRILARGVVATTLWNLLMASIPDKDDPTTKGVGYRFERAWKAGGMRWLDADITPIYHALGGDPTKVKYLATVNHFNDAIRWFNWVDIDPETGVPVISPKKGTAQTLRNKLSPAASATLEFFSGTDWLGRGYTSASELMGIDNKGIYQTTSLPHHIAGQPRGGKMAGKLTDRGADKGPVGMSRMPSFLLKQGGEVLPIPLQNLSAMLGGEIDAFDFITRSAGFLTSSRDLNSAGMRPNGLRSLVR